MENIGFTFIGLGSNNDITELLFVGFGSEINEDIGIQALGVSTENYITEGLTTKII